MQSANRTNSLSQSRSLPNLSAFFSETKQPNKTATKQVEPTAQVNLTEASCNLLMAVYEELKLSNNLAIEMLLTKRDEKKAEQEEQKLSDEKFENEIRSSLYT